METKEEKISIYLAGSYSMPSWRESFEKEVRKRNIEGITVINPVDMTCQRSSFDLVRGDIYEGSMKQDICLVYIPPRGNGSLGSAIEAGTAYASRKLLILIYKYHEKDALAPFFDLKFRDFDEFFETFIKKDYFYKKIIKKRKLEEKFPVKDGKILKKQLKLFLVGDSSTWKYSLQNSVKDSPYWKYESEKKVNHIYINVDGKAPLEEIANSDALVMYLQRNKNRVWTNERKAGFHSGIGFKCKSQIYLIDETIIAHPLLAGITNRKFRGIQSFDRFIIFLRDVLKEKNEMEAIYKSAYREGLL